MSERSGTEPQKNPGTKPLSQTERQERFADWMNSLTPAELEKYDRENNWPVPEWVTGEQPSELQGAEGKALAPEPARTQAEDAEGPDHPEMAALVAASMTRGECYEYIGMSEAEDFPHRNAFGFPMSRVQQKWMLELLHAVRERLEHGADADANSGAKGN
jgi:hypothetical protein